MRLKVLTVVGTRPEAIKMSPVIRALSRRDEIETRVITTAQHRELTDEALALFGIEPDHDLDLMTNGQTPSQIAGAIITRLEPVLRAERPDWLLVQGDTTTTMAAAIAASYAKVSIGHVEAGLRTHARREPFPEEMNRRIVGTIADLHFAATETARRNLLAEGVDASSIVVTGNPGIDALRWAWSLPAVADDPWAGGNGVRIVLVTAHRRENFGPGIEAICRAIAGLCDRYGDAIRVVWPVHPNPDVLGPVSIALGALKQVTLLAPLPYQSFVRLMARAFLVLSDSGGVQEEGPSLGTPVLVLRDVTERPEAVLAGTVRLVGTGTESIVAAVSDLWDDPSAHARMAVARNPYGDGRASERIVKTLLNEEVEPFDPDVSLETAGAPAVAGS